MEWIHRYRHLIDRMHTVVVFDDERTQEWMVEGLRCRDVGQDVPIGCDEWRFLGKDCKMVMDKFEGVCVCTDEHVPLVLCTPANSDGITVTGESKGNEGD